MDQSSATQNRKSRRSNVLMTATVESDGAAAQVKLRNLSAEGALVEGEGLPVEGSAVVFRRNELSARGRVAWLKGKQAGIAFDQELRAEQVLRHVPPVRQKIQPKFRRPGVVRHELSPEEQRVIDSCVWYQAPNATED
jgi:hypothetical protein